MTQPSQVFPPWLTPSVSTLTNAAGVPVATETTIVYLPLTYFGPSVPLGSLWIFGGSTSPASSVASTPLTTTAIPSLTTTATPTTSITSLSNSASTLTSNTATPISSISPTSTSSSFSLTSATTSSSIPSSTSTSSSTQISTLTKGQLVGVIVASILGLIFLFVLALFLFLWCKGRRNRQLVPLDEDGGYDVLSASDVEGYRPGDVYNGSAGHRVPGEGSPRQSGDEASSFLRQSHAGGPSFAETSTAGAATFAAMSQVPTELGVSHAIPRIPPPTTNSNSSGSQSSYSHASGFGVMIDRPNQGLGQLPSMSEQPEGSGLSAADLHRLDQENIRNDPDMYEDGQYTGAYAYATDSLLAPPRLLNPDYSPLNAEFPSHMSDLSEAEVLTAERRRIDSLIGPRTNLEIPGLPDFSESSQRSSSLLGAIGLGGLANLGRRSWFRNFDSQRHSPDFTVEPFTEKNPEIDLEMGQGMLSPDSIVDSRGRRVGAGPDGTRPLSTSSARSGTSGGTIYHDAQSSTPGTPLLPSLPRAVTPTPASVSSPGNQQATEHRSPLSGLPAYNDEDTVQSPGNTDIFNLRLNFDPNAVDILDMPAPAALQHFSSLSSLRDTTTGSSLGLKPFFPPGMDTVKPVGWSDVATVVTDSSPPVSNFGGAFLNNSLSSSGRITIDLLEDAPPGAELGWRSVASAGFGDAGKRGTFGLFVDDQSGFMSEQGSLHSMKSHFNPSVRSTGSAPASRRDGSSSIGTTSSRPSAHSLARTGSISSDGRRRYHTNSPSLSAFGYSQKRPSPLSNNNDFDEPSSQIPFNLNIGSPPCAHVTPDKTSTVRPSASAVTVMDDNSFGTVRGLPAGLVRSGSTSQMSSASFPLNTPWAAGLDNDWVPAA